MLALVMLLAGAAVTAVMMAVTIGTRDFVPAIAATVIQLAVAAALWLNLTGARIAAIGVLLAQLLVLMLLALVFMVLLALPLQGGGPILGHDFDPVWFAVIVTAIVLIIAVYLLAMRSAWRRSGTVVATA